jgi:hypothetical protein
MLMTAGFAAAFFSVSEARADGWLSADITQAEIRHIEQLIGQLGSRDFSERERATTSLIAAGASARTQLAKAVQGPDAEVRRRAGLILTRIDKDIDTARLLKPKRIHLVYSDTRVIDAVADFAKKSGYPLQFEGDRVRLGTRKITLDTGDVTFWEALDQFCRATGLMEPHSPRPTNPATAAAASSREVRLMELRMMQRRGWPVPPARIDFGRLVLVDGQETLPTSHMGAVRVRVLSPKTEIPASVKTSEEAVVVLEVSPEPGIDWRGVLAAQVEKATDAKGREIKQIRENVTPGDGTVNEWAGAVALNLNMANQAVIFAGGDIDSVGNQSSPPTREFPIRLKLPDRNTKSLNELRGTIYAQVQTPQEPVIRADKILQAEGKTFKGPENSFLKVHEVQKTDQGQVKLRVSVRAPSMGEDALAMMQGAVFVRRFNGRMAFLAQQQEGEPPTVQNLLLQDAKGRSYQLVSSEENTQANGLEITQEFRLVYQSKQGLETPAQLVYLGRRLVTVEIPFAFKNVKLSD